jgi:hypothetical protein
MDKRVTLKISRRLYNRAKIACKQETTVNALATFLVQSWVDDKERDSNIRPSAAAARTDIRTEKKAVRSMFPTQLPLMPPTSRYGKATIVALAYDPRFAIGWTPKAAS